MTAAEENAHIMKMWKKALEWQNKRDDAWRQDLGRWPTPARVEHASRMCSLYSKRLDSAKLRQIMRTTP